jgi:hypothetical protein
MYPPVPLTIRTNSCDDVFGGHWVPKGTVLIVSIGALGRHKDLWDRSSSELSSTLSRSRSLSLALALSLSSSLSPPAPTNLSLSLSLSLSLTHTHTHTHTHTLTLSLSHTHHSGQMNSYLSAGSQPMERSCRYAKTTKACALNT